MFDPDVDDKYDLDSNVLNRRVVGKCVYQMSFNEHIFSLRLNTYVVSHTFSQDRQNHKSNYMWDNR